MSTMTFFTAAGGVNAGPTASNTQRHAGSEPAVAHDDPNVFLTPLLDCLPQARRAMRLLVASGLALDVGAVLAEGLEPEGPGSAPDWRAWAAAWAGGAGLLLAAVSAGVLLMIGVRYTFEHVALHREHFYELKLARFREACAQLKSLSVKEAVGAVRALQGLRKDVGGLDRRLAIETLMLKRRLRDLLWLSRTAAGFGVAGAVALLILTGRGGVLAVVVPILAVLAGVALFILIELWMRDRMARVIELLAPAPADLAQAFDPSPPLEAAVERLLTRINRHFDRLKGPGDALEEENAPFA
jgi:uncharacterized membrane protein